MIWRTASLILTVILMTAWNCEAEGGVITYQASGRFVAEDATKDPLGLNNALFSFKASFDSSGVYANTVGKPTLKALSNSLAIRNASMSTTNGTYTEVFGIVFWPTLEGQLLGGSNGGSQPRWDIGGTLLITLNPPSSFNHRIDPGPAIGDTIKLGDFGTSRAPLFGLVSPSAQYDVVDFRGSAGVGVVAPVPEPGSLAIFGIALVPMVAVAARRRTKVNVSRLANRASVR